jgi:hypothetical protein
VDSAIKAWEKRLGPLSDLLPGSSRGPTFLRSQTSFGARPDWWDPQSFVSAKGTKRRLALSLRRAL